MGKIYTGIGSRETPQEVLELFINVARYLAEQGHKLRSGACKGPDKAFETGCDEGKGSKEIYIPWWGFEGNTEGMIVKEGKAYDIAEYYHPYWNNLSDGAKKLQARNSHQVLGESLDKPTDVIICWTRGGKGGGGTGQALRIAKALNIPVFDAGMFNDVETARKFLWNFLVNTGFISEN